MPEDKIFSGSLDSEMRIDDVTYTLFLCFLPGDGGGGGGYLTKFNTGRLHPEVQPLTLIYTILAEKVPLSYTFY